MLGWKKRKSTWFFELLLERQKIGKTFFIKSLTELSARALNNDFSPFYFTVEAQPNILSFVVVVFDGTFYPVNEGGS